MIIGIDIDDTITDTYEVIFNYAQEYTVKVLNRDPKIKEVSDCASHYYTKVLHNWSDDENEKFWELYYEKNLKEVKPKTLVVEYLNKLKSEGNKLVLITARVQPENYKFNVEEETKKWLQKNNVPYDKLIINGNHKEKIAKEEKIDLFIDDSFKNCQAVSDVGIKTYIMDSRVNRDLNRQDIERVYSWPHLYIKIKNNKRGE